MSFKISLVAFVVICVATLPTTLIADTASGSRSVYLSHSGGSPGQVPMRLRNLEQGNSEQDQNETAAQDESQVRARLDTQRISIAESGSEEKPRTFVSRSGGSGGVNPIRYRRTQEEE